MRCCIELQPWVRESCLPSEDAGPVDVLFFAMF
jgi:hypothetical protein